MSIMASDDNSPEKKPSNGPAYITAIASLLGVFTTFAAGLIGNHDAKGQPISIAQKVQLGFSVMAPSLVNPPQVVKNERDAVTSSQTTNNPQNDRTGRDSGAASKESSDVLKQPDSTASSPCIGLPKGFDTKSGTATTFMRDGKYGYVVRIPITNDTNDVASIVAVHKGTLTDDAQNDVVANEQSLTQDDGYRISDNSHSWLLANGSKIDAHRTQMVRYTFQGVPKPGSRVSFDASLMYAFGPAPAVGTAVDTAEGQTVVHCELPVQGTATP